MDQMIARTPKCMKIGIVDDNGEPYLVLFKTGKSKKPMAKVQLEYVLEIVDVHIDQGILVPEDT